MSDRAQHLLNLVNLAAAYRACLLGTDGKLTPAARRVLKDLGYYGHITRSTIKVSPVTRTVDTHASAVAEGRREVVRRIWTYLDLDIAEAARQLEQERQDAA